jgi:outer membrane protein assembly factor BamB
MRARFCVAAWAAVLGVAWLGSLDANGQDANAATDVAAGQPGTADASAEKADWSQWRGPNRDGHYVGPTWPDSLTGRLTQIWEVPLGPSYSGPVTNGDLVFTTETVDKQFERVTAFRLADGEKVWSVQWEGAMAVPFFAASNGDWIRSTPALDDNHLVVAGMRDVVVCLDPATGEERWRVDFAKQLGTNLQAFGCVCSPLIDGDAVFIQAGGGVTKLSLADGSVIWQALKDDGSMMTGGAFSSPIIATIDQQRQLVVATRLKLVGLSLEDGRELWSEDIESFRGMNILTPVIAGQGVFSSAHSGRSRLFQVAAPGGSVASVSQRWDNKSQAYMSTPVVVGDYLYMHLKNQRVVCIDARDGTEKWTTQPYGKYWSMITGQVQPAGQAGAPPTPAILALDQDGQLRLIAADPEAYRVLSEEKVAEDSWAHLAIQALDKPDADGRAPLAIIVRALDRLRVYRWQ